MDQFNAKVLPNSFRYTITGTRLNTCSIT